MGIIDFIKSIGKSSSKSEEDTSEFHPAIRVEDMEPEKIAASELIADSKGKVKVEGWTPYGGGQIEDQAESERAAKMFQDVESEVGEKLEEEHYSNGVNLFIEDEDLEFRIIQNDFNPDVPSSIVHHDPIEIVYAGTLENNVEPEEVEDLLSPYGVDRNTEGWELSIHDSLEDFQSADEEYSIGADSLANAVLKAEVADVEYYGQDQEINHPEEVYEVVSELADSREVEDIKVEEFDVGSRKMYSVNVEDFYNEDGIQINLTYSGRLFENRIEENEPEMGRAIEES